MLSCSAVVPCRPVASVCVQTATRMMWELFRVAKYFISFHDSESMSDCMVSNYRMVR